ncbi:MAG: acetyl-CoA C-acyltransferase [Polyangiales bacterium]
MANSRRRVAIVAGARTPFAKAGTKLKAYSALDLARHAVDGLLDKHALEPKSIDEMVYGIVVLDPRRPQFAREVAFASQLPTSTPAWTVTDNCITGTTAMMAISDSIVAGRAEIGIAGGVESMSNPAVLFSPEASRVFVDLSNARTLKDRLELIATLRPRDLKPNAPGVVEPSTGLSMGEHTEITVKEWKIEREPQDELTLASHQNAAAATADGRLKDEIIPLDGIDQDTIFRPDTSLEKLASLNPVFDRSPAGTLTAGNSSPLTDGAAAIALMSEDRARREGREPLAFIRGYKKVAIDPGDGLLMGPGIAVPDLLEETGLALDDMDLIEMHEAFAGQVLSNIAAWEQGWKRNAIGKVDHSKLNQLGSSIAVGHPFSATGVRIATTLANEMKRRNARYGLISICAAGAMAQAMILERDV